MNRKRRFRPLRRLLLLLIIVGLGYGLFSCSRLAYRTLFPELRVQPAVLASAPLLTGRAVVLRDEVVVVAGRAGLLNQLREHGSSVSAGEIMFEIVDANRLAAIDRQLAHEAERMATSQAQSPEVITHLRTQLTAAQAAVRELATRYAYYLRVGDSTEATRVFTELRVAHEKAQASREGYAFAARSQEQYAARRAELQNQRRQAILAVTSPLAGVLNFALDGWEKELRVDDYRSLPLATVRQVNRNPSALENMDALQAGQVVGSIIDPRRVILLMEASSVALGEAVEVVYGEVVLTASVLSTATNDGTVSGLVALRVTNPPSSLLTTRIAQVSVEPQGETLTEIPLRAVLTRETGDMVYVQAADGELIERTVLVRHRRDGVAVVSGLGALELVVTNPKALLAERR
ncbi:MAG: hypothetical protein DDT39_00730 [Firmicutes bacterium]|nr:hypothetical protein [candidate division NPL-UPA2 bacterium]